MVQKNAYDYTTEYIENTKCVKHVDTKRAIIVPLFVTVSVGLTIPDQGIIG
jgi:hypothetical protein